MMNGAEGPAMEQPDDEVPPTSTTSSSVSAAPASPSPMTPVYRAPVHGGSPGLRRGIVWSDLVREMDQQNGTREAEMVGPLRQGHTTSGDPAAGIEEAA